MIHVNQEIKQFHLTNGKISYIFHVMKNGQLGHLYMGSALHKEGDYSHFQAYDNPSPYTTHVFEDDPSFSLETVRQEFPVHGKGDFREPASIIVDEQGEFISDYVFQSYEVVDGKPELNGLPAAFGEKGSVQTLKVSLLDLTANVGVDLYYSIFADLPIITRSVKVVNNGEQSVNIERLMSTTFDLPDADYEMLHLSGAWGRERHIRKRNLEQGVQSIGSIRGSSSHHHNPFLVLKRQETTEHHGEAIGVQFVYSGNFLAQAEVDHYETTRISMGIHPTGFQWKLEPEDSFQAPESVISYTKEGLNGLSHSLHDFQRHHLISQKWMERERPVLINNWEATYFNFNEGKLDQFIVEAKELGVELFVLDDGWFGNRNDDTTSLGDWYVDRSKLPNGIGELSKKVKASGLQFGLWFEPEMVSPESELIKKHPEWVVGSAARSNTLGRNQRVLDLANPEVVHYLYEKISAVIEEADLDYIKWDMNRNITEPYAMSLQNQGEFFHRYMLGVYELYERLTSSYPDLLFESCAGGGGRFDLGMMYYAPQAWTSDDTDAVERLKIQYGTSLGYPLSTMGSHVSAVPNHQTLRSTPLRFRGDVAYFGTFGYELDPSQLKQEEKEEIKQQIRFFIKHRSLIQGGHFYRLKSPFIDSETAWMVVSEDRKKALVGWYQPMSMPNPPGNRVLKLKGLDESFHYKVNGQMQLRYGNELMERGLALPVEFNGANHHAQTAGDCQSIIFELRSD
ncbi:alpha-galactosidase [Halobacillus mangrovi]|uniref:Alpha-galactosidase n=1 Tax=Halobacillus mangrovi TaxID=402384 RepID=A0A1W5ZS74_9BACI|nr:alpha-galactosidase [Halobacillus mangrovi]ARI76139.1 alpha-galactosidase [Halobacillus mangrovi]